MTCFFPWPTGSLYGPVGPSGPVGFAFTGFAFINLAGRVDMEANLIFFAALASYIQII
jgi:hypothetical protein